MSYYLMYPLSVIRSVRLSAAVGREAILSAQNDGRAPTLYAKCPDG